MSEIIDNNLKMPLLFLGHGNPMNAIEDNEFAEGWRNTAKTMPRPSAVLCISAHWETKGTYITAGIKPETIHDFGGFPEVLYKVQYRAKGSPELAEDVMRIVRKTVIVPDKSRGLDHGCWSVISRMYPDADIPVVQLSLDHYKDPQYHFDLAKELAPLRKKGILIAGSGNIVHNLGLADWNRLYEEYGYDWAIEAREKINRCILDGDNQKLINYGSQGRAFELAVPTPEHYLPLLYILALKEDNEKVTLFNDKALAGSLTMTCVRIDP